MRACSLRDVTAASWIAARRSTIAR